MSDLFETPELIPAEVQNVLDTFDQEQDGYKECERIKQELNLIGYDYDYYLDAEPFNLHKITH